MNQTYHLDDDAYFKHLGLQCGLEIHQQLNTDKKLFCRCHATLRRDKPDSLILRHMRPTLSELGEYDGTALMEFKTKKNVIYQLYHDTVCTYEMDDTPPFHLNPHALDIALEIALLLNYSIVDELHISRKQYLDGSIPTGFQRTGIVGVEGWIPYKDRKIRLIQLGLEEDACREISDQGHQIVFKTDRLSIPLVEVVTYPDIQTPQEAGDVARLIGRILRSTGKVRRGLGSIRQDVNVSITGGTRIELKGISKLQYIPRAVAIEAQRQKALLTIRDELRLRGITDKTFSSEHKDVTTLFKHTRVPRFKETLRHKGIIAGILLRNYAGILDMPTQPGKTFADELAGRVRVIACLDSMPNILINTKFQNFGVSTKEIKTLERLFSMKPTDALVLVWGPPDDVHTALEEIKQRAVEATNGVPSETRQVFPTGINDFERILPGPNRMYPDTDTPPTSIPQNRLETIRKNMPQHLWETERQLRDLGIPSFLATKLSISKNLSLFQKIIKDFNLQPMLVAVTLEETLTFLRRKGTPVHQLSDQTLYQVFQGYHDKKFSKEALPVLLEFLANHPDTTVSEALTTLQITPLSHQDLEKLVEKIVAQYKQSSRTSLSFHHIMGEVMKEARMRIDGKTISDLVYKKLQHDRRTKTT
ncbi:MAG: Glu-tRNA(Gln) amidotransferase subunit GatE [Candidatus Thermoplasmatota archaeon]